jgi:hypothetical protein
MRGPDAPVTGRRRASQTDMPAIRAGDQPAAPPERVRRTSLSNWSVSTRLVALFVMASVLGLVFGGLRIADAVESASSYSRSAQLADVGQQLTQLAQAMEDERDLTAGLIALTMLQQNAHSDAAGPTVVASLSTAVNREQDQVNAAQVTTNAAARRAQALVEGIGSAYPANVRAKAANVLKQITYLLEPGGLRLTTKELGQDVANGSADTVISSYSGVLSILFALEDEITTGSGDVQLGDDVRALLRGLVLGRGPGLAAARDPLRRAHRQRAQRRGQQRRAEQQRHRAGRA